MQGIGVAQDAEEAVRLYSLAASAGDQRAQFCFARALEVGTGVAQDTAQAIKWYLAAARQGMTEAIHSVMRLDTTTNYIFYKS
jgi:hypothetical protein